MPGIRYRTTPFVSVDEALFVHVAIHRFLRREGLITYITEIPFVRGFRSDYITATVAEAVNSFLRWSFSHHAVSTGGSLRNRRRGFADESVENLGCRRVIRSIRHSPDIHSRLDDDLHRLRHHVGVVVESLIPENGPIRADDEAGKSFGDVLRFEHAVPFGFAGDDDVVEPGVLGRFGGMTDTREG